MKTVPPISFLPPYLEGRKKKTIKDWDFFIYFFFLKIFIIKFIYFFGLLHSACGILVPQPRTEPSPPAVDAQSVHHWTTRKTPKFTVLTTFKCIVE